MPDLRHYETARLFGGPRDGEHYAVEPGLSHLVVYELDQPHEWWAAEPDESVTRRTSTYRRETFVVANVGAIAMFVHETLTQEDVGRIMLETLVQAFNARPVSRR